MRKFISLIIAVFSRMRGNKILEKLTVQDSNTPHSCDYRYKNTYKQASELSLMFKYYSTQNFYNKIKYFKI